MILPIPVAVQVAAKSVTSVVSGHCDYLPWAPKGLTSYLLQVSGSWLSPCNGNKPRGWYFGVCKAKTLTWRYTVTVTSSLNNAKTTECMRHEDRHIHLSQTQHNIELLL
jgi:hypothetical protein